jgi:hypothetical protein
VPPFESLPSGATKRTFSGNDEVTEREAGLDKRLNLAFDTATVNEEPESVEIVPEVT